MAAPRPTTRGLRATADERDPILPALGATLPLEAALPPEEVVACADAIVDATFVHVADLLTTYEPD